MIDGYKRIGVLVPVLLLRENNYKIAWNNEDFVNIGLDIAATTMDKDELTPFIPRKLNKN
ncbi:hypothetical protein O6R05_00675 [Peptoniphilus equinus]|uniref:Fido domain-containing protein n=1 Tax=Peptoniphilus equinus TaxID=3016343 RepID=A0ABY7QV92_9FIRM|nr:hypothetical protein [Peptoniphilus equinus]WBW50108.1 hypothetical protein O6R05_00675 [Peptoniphilus equinus]